jgi:glycosyltransferase involved in cell wall biosynthesis
MEPLVTVVIPLYNKEKSIARAINSVLNQTEQNFEIIVVNDGSTDNSASAVENLQVLEKLKLIHQENRGECAARNRGIKEASTELIAFLDADDEWLPEFLETILALRAQFPIAEVYGTSYFKRNGNGILELPCFSFKFGESWKGIIQNYFETILKNNPFCASSMAATKNILEKIDGFPPKVKYGGDADTFIRLSLAAKIAYINKPLAIVNLEAENRVTALLHDPSEEFHQLKTVQRLIESNAIPELLRQSTFEYKAKVQLRLARNFLVFGDTKSAKMLIQSSKGTKKFISKWYWLSLWASIPPFLYMPLIKFRRELRQKIIE